jgi:hypothetical protein
MSRMRGNMNKVRVDAVKRIAKQKAGEREVDLGFCKGMISATSKLSECGEPFSALHVLALSQWRCGPCARVRRRSPRQQLSNAA